MEAQLNDPSVKQAKLNRSQALLHLINPNVAYCLWPRASGKTSGGIGPRLNHLSQVMPRSQIILLSDKFERLHDVLVPSIESFMKDELGLVEGWDYVTFKKPPDHFKAPLFPLNKYDHVISFSSGMALCGASLKVSGSANGYNAQALIGDEVKYFNEQKMKTEVFPAIRGGRKHFGDLPEFQSKWFFTDKWEGDDSVPGAKSTASIQWLLKKKKEINQEAVDIVYALQLEVIRLQQEMSQYSSKETIYKYKSKIIEIEKVLAVLRKDLVYYSDALPYENIEVLGEKFFRDLKRDLTEYEYEVAIENQDPDRAIKPYYPNLSKQHFYKNPNDWVPVNPLIITLDYQYAITPVVTAQFNQLPGSAYITLNFIRSLHTLHPESIDKAIDLWCDEFESTPVKIVYYIFNQTAIGRSPHGTTYKDRVVKALNKRGWAVVEVYTGDTPDHGVKFEAIKRQLARTGDGAIQINEETNIFLIKAMKKTNAVLTGGQTKKDKTSETSSKVPPEESTHYPDAWDDLVWGALELQLVPMTSDPGFDISCR